MTHRGPIRISRRVVLCALVFLLSTGRQTNLRRLWDGDLIDHVYPNAVARYKPVRAVLQSAQWQDWDSGGPADRAMEIHGVAREAVLCPPQSGD